MATPYPCTGTREETTVTITDQEGVGGSHTQDSKEDFNGTSVCLKQARSGGQYLCFSPISLQTPHNVLPDSFFPMEFWGDWFKGVIRGIRLYFILKDCMISCVLL